MKINDLSYNATGARYGYNSQEQSTELNLDGNHTTAEFWEYDARNARRWNLDPVVKQHTSGYNTFASNPIWFTDMNGADSSLYSSNTGKFINRGITPEDDKTSVWTVDDQAKGYDKNNPWATATPLKYTTPEKKNIRTGEYEIVGDQLRKGHPLRTHGSFDGGWFKGDQVYEEDLLDLTSEFYQIVNTGKDIFKQIKQRNSNNLFTSTFDDYQIFAMAVKPNGPFDLKSYSRSNTDWMPSYALKHIGEYALMDGYLWNNDDFGNVAYGAWGRAFGYSKLELLDAANLAQKIDNWWNDKGWVGDPLRDQTMIKIGFENFGK